MSKDNLGYYKKYPYEKDEKREKLIAEIADAIDKLLSRAWDLDIEYDVLSNLGLEKILEEDE